MSTAVEDRLRQRAYERFIDENPIEIILERGERTRTPAGGYVWTKTGDIPAQRGRLIESNARSDEVVRTMPDGAVLVISATLVFPNGANVERWDRFTIDGKNWLVGSVTRQPDWRVACAVGRRDA